jgi:hypothetical protein
MPRAFTTRKWELTSRGRDYQLIPTFPRLPGIIPESPASETTLAGRPLRKPSVLSKNHAPIIAHADFIRKGPAKKNLLTNNLCTKRWQKTNRR